MSDADVPRDPWGNPIPDGVRPPTQPPASQMPPPPPTSAPAPSPSGPTSPPPSAPASDPTANPAWPGASAPDAAPVPPQPPAAWGPPPGSGPWPAPPPPNPYADPTAAPARPRSTGTAIASLVCGIASILCTGFLGIVLGPTAIGLGVRARRTIADSNGWRTGEGMATAGIVCGIIGTLLSIVYLVFLIRNPQFLTDFLNDLTTTTTTEKLQGA